MYTFLLYDLGTEPTTHSQILYSVEKEKKTLGSTLGVYLPLSFASVMGLYVCKLGSLLGHCLGQVWPQDMDSG